MKSIAHISSYPMQSLVLKNMPKKKFPMGKCAAGKKTSLMREENRWRVNKAAQEILQRRSSDVQSSSSTSTRSVEEYIVAQEKLDNGGVFTKFNVNSEEDIPLQTLVAVKVRTFCTVHSMHLLLIVVSLVMYAI